MDSVESCATFPIFKCSFPSYNFTIRRYLLSKQCGQSWSNAEGNSKVSGQMLYVLSKHHLLLTYVFYKLRTYSSFFLQCNKINLKHQTWSNTSRARTPGPTTSSTSDEIWHVTCENKFLSSLDVSIKFQRSISWVASSCSCAYDIQKLVQDK